MHIYNLQQYCKKNEKFKERYMLHANDMKIWSEKVKTGYPFKRKFLKACFQLKTWYSLIFTTDKYPFFSNTVLILNPYL